MLEEATPETEPSTSADADLDVGDLAAKLFTDEPEEGTEAGEADPAPEAEPSDGESEGEPSEPSTEQPRHKIKVNGQEVEVTQDELLKGYSRNEDYKQKTAKLAEQQRNFERAVQQEVAKQTQAERNRLFSSLGQYVQMVESGFDPAIARGLKTDWEARMREDPVNGPAEHAGFQRKLAEFHQAKRALAEHAQEQERAAENERMRHIAEAHETLVQKLPEWGDDAKRTEFQSKIRPIFHDLGYTDKEIDGMTDWRVFPAMKEILELRQWKANIAKGKAKQVKEPVKVAQPKASKEGPTQTAKQKALEQRANSGRPEDIAAYAASLDW
mgnify:CR=1 FL=1